MRPPIEISIAWSGREVRKQPWRALAIAYTLLMGLGIPAAILVLLILAIVRA